MAMFGDLNKATIMGNLTGDPDLRYTPSGSAVLNFSVATNRRYKVNEEWKDDVTFHNVVVWRSAENLAKRLQKGTRVLIEGRMQTRSWDDAETGKKRYKTEVVADDVILIARYVENDQLGDSSADSGDNNGASNSGNSASNTEINPDDLPF